MKNKRSNKQLYRDTFDQIKLSDQGYRQIRNMEENTMIQFNKKQKKRMAYRAVVSLAALTVVFLSANGIAYAATGSTLIEQVVGHVSVYINGKPYDGAKVTKIQDKNGDTHYQVTVDEKTDHSTEIHMDESVKDGNISIEKDAASSTPEDTAKDPSSASQETPKTTVKQVDDTIYLIIEGISKKPVQVDITQDYANGSAEGTLQIKNAEYQYSVRGTLEEYTVDFEKR